MKTLSPASHFDTFATVCSSLLENTQGSESVDGLQIMPQSSSGVRKVMNSGENGVP